MGLDITAYRKLVKVDALFDADGEPVDPGTREPIKGNYMVVRVNHDFPGRAEPLEDGAVYGYAQYKHVFSRSYGGYNAWREALARLAGYPEISHEGVAGYPPSARMRCDAAAWAGLCEGMPFVELVNFSDCEGVIGPVVAVKLARDFAEWDERAKTSGVLFFYEGYSKLREGMEIAADDGALKFS